MTNEIPVRIEAAALAVSTRGLEKRYGRQRALAGLDLTVPEGSFYVLVGPNGAGKSTTLGILLDLVRADAGEALVLGVNPAAGPAARANIGFVPEKHDEPYGWLRVEELLDHHAAYHPSWDRQYAMALARTLDVAVTARFGRMSKGECRRVQLVLALAHRPALLLLDEPTDGLDPLARETFLGVLAEHLADTPTTVLASTHLVREMEGLADHMGVLRQGTMLTQVRRDELGRRLRSYAFETPADASVSPGVVLMRRNGNGRESRWTIWGDEQEVVARFTEAGVSVRDVAPLTLEDSALAFLSVKE
jgi:ABC-type multidrug transport system ATPase subunit